VSEGWAAGVTDSCARWRRVKGKGLHSLSLSFSRHTRALPPSPFIRETSASVSHFNISAINPRPGLFYESRRNK